MGCSTGTASPKGDCASLAGGSTPSRSRGAVLEQDQAPRGTAVEVAEARFRAAQLPSLRLKQWLHRAARWRSRLLPRYGDWMEMRQRSNSCGPLLTRRTRRSLPGPGLRWASQRRRPWRRMRRPNRSCAAACTEGERTPLAASFGPSCPLDQATANYAKAGLAPGGDPGLAT